MVEILVVAGREPDHRRLGGGPVVRPGADLADLHLAPGLEAGQHVDGEVDGVGAGEHRLGHQPPLAAPRTTEPVHGGVVEDKVREQLPLPVGLPEAAQAARLLQRVDTVGLADLVAPGPGELDAFHRHPGHGEREPRHRRRRQLDRPVGRGHRDVAPQPRQEVGHQVVPVGHRDDQRVAARDQPAYLRPDALGQRGQHEHPPARRVPRRPDRDAVALVAEEVDVLGGVPVAVEPDAEAEVGVAGGGGVDVHLDGDRVGVQVDPRQPGTGHQRDPDLPGPAQQRPQRRAEPGERQVGLGAEVGLPGSRAIGRQQLAEHRDLRRRAALAGVEVGDVLPAGPGLDPVVAAPRARAGGPGACRGPASGCATRTGTTSCRCRLQLHLQRERMGVLRDPFALVELVEHGGEPSLPRAAAVGLGVGDVLASYDEEQRERVLAAVADRAAAAAVDPRRRARPRPPRRSSGRARSSTRPPGRGCRGRPRRRSRG